MSVVMVFKHTSGGNDALAELLKAGVEHAAISVIGDVGPAMSQPGAERHVTFDVLQVPQQDRTLLMDTIRAGGVVVAVTGFDDLAQKVADASGALRVFNLGQTENPSHNTAR